MVRSAMRCCLPCCPGWLPASPRPLVLTTGAAANNAAPRTAQELVAAGFKAAVTINLGGQTYSASADERLASGSNTAWLSGPVVGEWPVSAPLKTAAGAAHPT